MTGGVVSWLLWLYLVGFGAVSVAGAFLALDEGKPAMVPVAIFAALFWPLVLAYLALAPVAWAALKIADMAGLDGRAK